ncbi:peptidoglycan D,D-transpeptidase FtsI family protein [Actinokineospora terrae]|uniref:Cell division protein FtsI (Penicillin-binding protein 3) n=1 Tax=Actinokineospora terrae TaxID=155974 RepID=A0A1H9TM48_9PSEU|nr:penicillin-binding protein 2 [Actinokineospora terrae]SER97999.1 cell division protein FtsI (penicillin-binding protein 3) [Actinokineospora terrae]
MRLRRVTKRSAGTDHRVRVVVVRFLLIASLVAAGLKLVQVQGFEAEALAARAERQRLLNLPIPATRGSIVDRNGVELAFSVDVKALAYRPAAQRKALEELAAKSKAKDVVTFDEETASIAADMARVLGSQVSEQDLLTKLRSEDKFTYLATDVEPAKARELVALHGSLNVEDRAKREYPGGSLAANVLGYANWRMEDPEQKKHSLHGLIGLEMLRDNDLSGTPGVQVVETASGTDVVIVGAPNKVQPAVNGSDVELTIDADLQYFVQQKAAEFGKRSQAKSVSVVVLDAKTGEIYALANDKTFDPNAPGGLDPKLLNDAAVTTPYEPGSVNKIVTAMGAIEYGITTPDAVHSVPGSVQVADRTVSDAWPHGRINLTTTGVFAKSSNVGTLMLADQIGQDRYAALLDKLGIGKRTGVGLPGESPGRLLPRNQWSGSTFGNLPIGQGLSMTVLQMAGMYQAIANDGVRVPPRIVRAKIAPDGTRVEEPRPEAVRVVSPETARTTRDMLRAVTQKAPNGNSGTAPAAAVTGYQISGKTGTAQQFDQAAGRYSDSKYWITFAGILPADSPRFVVGMVYDTPSYSTPDGHSAAPFFHDVAAFLTQRYSIPLSTEAAPVVPLVR